MSTPATILPNEAWTIREKCFLGAAFLLILLSIGEHFYSGDAGDKAWLFVAARKWVEGRTLYVDIIEVNPPLILYIYGLASFIALHLGARDYYVLVALGVGIVGLSLMVCGQLIRHHPMFADSRRRRAYHLILLAFVLLFFISPLYGFDREHFFQLLIYPYILRFMPSLARAPLPQGLRISVGLLAAVGFYIKPHCLLVLAGIQLLYWQRERSLAILWSLENRLIYGMGVLYLLAIWFFTPAYFTLILPMALITYSSYGRKITIVLQLLIAALIAGLSFVDFRLRYRSPYRRDILYFIGICVLFLLYTLINNGWGYTISPLNNFLLFTTGWIILEYRCLTREYKAKGLPFKPFVLGMRSCILNLSMNALIVLASFYQADAFNCDEDVNCKRGKVFAQEITEKHIASFGTISTEFGRWTELTDETGAQWVTRFNAIWMIPKFFLQGKAFTEKNQWILDWTAKAYALDLNHYKPALMFVDDSPEFFNSGMHVDLIAFFSRTTEFRAAWQHYRLHRILDICVPENPDDGPPLTTSCRYDVFERIP